MSKFEADKDAIKIAALNKLVDNGERGVGGWLSPSGSNHVHRVAEGRRLLNEGKSLAAMQTPVYIVPNDILNTTRESRIEEFHGMSTTELQSLIEDVEHEIWLREQSLVGGTSEQRWIRIQVLATLEKRGIDN